MTYVLVTCPGCARNLRVRREYVGSRVQCSFCDRVMVIREGASTASPPFSPELTSTHEFPAYRRRELAESGQDFLTRTLSVHVDNDTRVRSLEAKLEQLNQFNEALLHNRLAAESHYQAEINRLADALHRVNRLNSTDRPTLPTGNGVEQPSGIEDKQLDSFRLKYQQMIQFVEELQDNRLEAEAYFRAEIDRFANALNDALND